MADSGTALASTDRGGAHLATAFLAGRTVRTLEAYAADLDVFAAWWGLPDRQAATAQLIGLRFGEANALALAYRADMLARGLAPATINRRLATLRSVVKLGNVLGLVSWRLTVEAVKSQPYRDTRGPGIEVFRSMKALCARRTDPKGLRDVAIVRLLHDVALRRGELVALNLDDVEVDQSTISVTGKGRTEKAPMTLPAATLAALRAWIDARGAAPGPLFVGLDRSGRSVRLTGRAVHLMIRRLGASLGAEVRPHGLRHLAITTVLDRNGGNMRAAQRFSRHRDIRVLALYDDNLSDMGGQMAALIAD